MTARQLIKLLEQNGFQELRQRGSHRIYKNPENNKQVTVPLHTGKDLKPGTLHQILQEVGLK